MFEKSIFLKSLQDIYDAGESDKAVNFIKDNLSLSGLTEDDIVFLKYYLAREYFFNNQYRLAEPLFCSISENKIYSTNVSTYLSEIYANSDRLLDSVFLLNNIYRSNDSYNHVIKNISHKLDLLYNHLYPNNNRLSITNILTTDDIPLVSIIILCYNKVEYTRKCLKSLIKNTKDINYEVIVVDNGSVDETPDYLLSYGDTIKFIKLDKNLGFVGGNNYASQFAKGEYLVFLNNDTEPQEGWLINLYTTFLYYNDCGAAGSMLVYPDGILQEAGGVIFRDASGWNYGKGTNPNDSKYLYCREVDYCSGAALMIRKDLFDKIGRFDERYYPAYYEDTDLCFSVRKYCFRVFYNPLSRVIHHEGATAGTDLNSGYKKYQVINAPKFIEKWKVELTNQYPNDPTLHYKFSDRNKGKRVLIIDDIPPLPDRSAGALRHYHTLNQMLILGYKVTYVHLMGKQYTDEAGIKYLADYKLKGVEFIWFNYEYWYNIRCTQEGKETIKTLINSLELKYRFFDFAYIAFWHIAEYFIDLIKEQIPQVPILIDTMDIHYLREKREAEISCNSDLKSIAQDNMERELLVYSKADVITTVTENDRLELQKHIKDKPIFILTDVHDPRYNTPTYEERKDLVFVGNFNHKPNADAVLYFIKDIYPSVKSKIPDIVFYIVGNNPTEEIKSLASKDVIVTGWVPDVKEYIDKCRLEVVPLRYGAGNKGKVGEALSSGIPIVTTSIGAEGMGIEHDIHAFVTDDSNKFAKYIIDLYSCQDIWNRFSQEGKKLVSFQYSSALMNKRLSFIFNHTKNSLNTHLSLKFSSPPDISIVIVADNQCEYTLKCVKSIEQYLTLNYEIILIDNASSDNTNMIFTKDIHYVQYFRNEKKINFPAAVNQGISKALGNYVLVLNNDTIITKYSIERLLDVANSNDNFGIVGPISNEVMGLQKDNDADYKALEEMVLYAEEVRQKNKGLLLHFPRITFLCILIKKEVIEIIGGLDERFSYGNFADDDFCLRAQLAEFKTLIAKDVFIHHFNSKYFMAEKNEQYQKLLEKDHRKFISKWGADPDEIWLKGVTPKSRTLRIPLQSQRSSELSAQLQECLNDNDYESAHRVILELLELAKSPGSGIQGDQVENLKLLAGKLEAILQ